MVANLNLEIYEPTEEEVKQLNEYLDSDIGQIGHWVNQISPDNYNEIFPKLCVLIFGDRKALGEPGFV